MIGSTPSPPLTTTTTCSKKRRKMMREETELAVRAALAARGVGWGESIDNHSRKGFDFLFLFHIMIIHFF
jgi:hypothetical protein